MRVYIYTCLYICTTIHSFYYIFMNVYRFCMWLVIYHFYQITFPPLFSFPRRHLWNRVATFTKVTLVNVQDMYICIYHIYIVYLVHSLT